MNYQESVPKILVVDDSVFDLQLVEWILQEKNYNTVIAKSGKEALEAARTFVPDLILLDIMLPDMTGFEVCVRIKKIEVLKDIPVIFITALSNVEDIVKGFEAGGVDYVTKPFNRDELLVRIKNHLDLISSKRQIELQAHELALSNALKNKLFSVISHDLRAPVGSIKQTLDFIASGLIKPGEELFDETIDNLRKTSDEAYILLENLLGWAKSQSNILHVLPEPINLKSLASSIMGLLNLSYKTKKIDVENRIPDETIVFADLQMVNSVLRNLLSNAMKFTPANGLIRIHSEIKGDLVEISVTDTGVGIAESDLKKVFNAENPLKTFGTNNESGSGLGLLLCKDFIEKNGGKIWIESKAGKGSTFTFTLPAQPKT